MLDRIPWVYCEAAIGVALCAVVGAVLGLAVELVRIGMEARRGTS